MTDSNLSKPNERPSGSISQNTAPTLPTSLKNYQPMSEMTFRYPFKLHISAVGGGSNSSNDNNLTNAASFPDLARFTNVFLNAKIVSTVPGTNTPGCRLIVSPRVDHDGVFRAAGYARPTAGSVASSYLNCVARPGSAIVSLGSNSTSLIPQTLESWIALPNGVSPLFKGPVVAEILPRFDFRFEGNANASVDIFLYLEIELAGAGYGYTQ